MFPFRFLGMGLFIAWLCCTHTAGIFPPEGAPQNALGMLDYSMRVGDIATLLLLAIMFGGRSPLSDHKVLVNMLVGLSALGALALSFLILPAGGPAWLQIICGIGMAPGGSVLLLLWAEIYGQLGLSKIIMYGAASCVAAGAASLGIFLLQAPYGTICASLLPLASLGCAQLSLAVIPKEPPSKIAAQTRSLSLARFRAVPWSLIALMALAGFASSFLGNLMLETLAYGSFHRIGTTTILGCAIFIAATRSRDGFSLDRLSVVVPLTASATLLLIPTLGTQAELSISILAKFCYVGFTFLVLAMLAQGVYRHETPSLWVFGLARASSEAAIFGGIIAYRMARAWGITHNVPALWLLSLFGFAVMALCIYIVHQEKRGTSEWGVLCERVTSTAKPTSAREQFVERCDMLADQYGLTPREKDILILLAQGRSGREIENELLLSQNTVKTHARHLYAKLGLHSKEDIRNLVMKKG